VRAFTLLWTVTFFCYTFQTLFSFAIDPATSRRAWFEGLTFPGLMSVAIMVIAVLRIEPFAEGDDWANPDYWSPRAIAVQLILGWTAISTAAAYGVYRLDKAGAPKWLRDALLVLVGYGPLLCAIAVGAIMAELRNADLKWDKTIKSGKARIQA
jgi:hypothetical protein